MSLLPSRPDSSPSEDAGPRVVDVDSEDAEDVLSALSSETARDLLSALHDDPAPPSDLADRVGTTLQNAQYHLGNLEDAGAVEVVDTAYSAKGREMDVYAPADQPLVIFAGDDDEESTLRTALSRLLGAVGLLAVASFAVQQLFGPGGFFGPDTERSPAVGGDAGGAGGADSTPTPTPESDTGTTAPETADGPVEATDAANLTEKDTVLEAATETADTTNLTEATPTETVDPETTTAAADATREVAAGLPPGLVFFAGGLFALAVVAAVLYYRR